MPAPFTGPSPPVRKVKAVRSSTSRRRGHHRRRTPREGGDPRRSRRVASLRRASGFVGIYITPDLANATGNYERPFLNTLQQELIAAGRGGGRGRRSSASTCPASRCAATTIPTRERSTACRRCSSAAPRRRQLKALAAQGGVRSVAVAPRWIAAKTRNVVATLPGRSPQKIVLGANTDGKSWVQENGVTGMIAFARYYAEPADALPAADARDRVHQRPRRDRQRRDGPLQRTARDSTSRARSRSRSRSSTSARARSSRPARAPTGISRSPARASRSCSPLATATCCAKPRRRRPSAASSTAPPSCAASGSRCRPGAADLLDGRAGHLHSTGAWSRRWR